MRIQYFSNNSKYNNMFRKKYTELFDIKNDDDDYDFTWEKIEDFIKKSNIFQKKEENDINFWKPCHRIIYSSESLIKLFKRSGYKIINWSITDDYNYRVLSLHKKYGYNKVTELRNSLIVNKNLPELNMYKKILKKALFIRSKALYGIFLFKKE